MILSKYFLGVDDPNGIYHVDLPQKKNHFIRLKLNVFVDLNNSLMHNIIVIQQQFHV
jgi:hypothetical protein